MKLSLMVSPYNCSYLPLFSANYHPQIFDKIMFQEENAIVSRMESSSLIS